MTPPPPTLPIPPRTHTPTLRPPPPQVYNGEKNEYYLAARRMSDAFWHALRSSVLPGLEAAGIEE